MSFLTGIAKIFGDANEKLLKKLQPIVNEINKLESNFQSFSNEKLKEKTNEFKRRVNEGEGLDQMAQEAFALVREAAKRTLNQRHFDVQLLGGIILHQGQIAEMRTGEGKTLTSTLAVYLNAIDGRGVHVVTVNDYLARRDTVWMGQVYHMLGLSVGCINHSASYIYDPQYQSAGQASDQLSDEPDEERAFKIEESCLRPVSRREAYDADITYGTNNEFGFDYLRDNMVSTLKDKVQRQLNYVIIDEVDSILIDEARTPLIISAPDEEAGELYRKFARIAPHLKEGKDYNIDEKMKATSLTDEGISKVEKMLGIDNIYTEGGIREVHHLEQALRAYTLFKKDRDYIVKDGEVIIVDEFTGRLMPGRRYSEGLHQAIEAKEGLEVKKESRTLASITFQNYFRLYKKIAGMTGTAVTSAEEFHKVYNLDVVVIPTNKPMIRKDLPDSIYQTEKGKFTSLIREIRKKHENGQPVLIGTVSIEKNELLSALLKKEGIPHQVLNAKHHEMEGEIIAQAGRLGAVTVATNMAGRGVDIMLGGNPPNLEESRKVKEAGGLSVIGTERHEARRIDNQLRGRAGRQGDPGSTQFFVSMEDDLMRIFGSDKVKNLMGRLGLPEDQPIENKMISNAIEKAQAKIEGYNFDLRKHILEYDDVMNKQREIIYKKRNELLELAEKGKLKNKIMQMIENQIKKVVDFHTVHEYSQDWNLEEIAEVINSFLPAPSDLHKQLMDIKGSADAQSARENIYKYLVETAHSLYERKEKDISSEDMRNLEKFVALRTLDMLWMDHLDTMDHLRDSVRLRAYGQRDPLVEYKNEGHKMFQRLVENIEMNIVNTIYRVSLVKSAPLSNQVQQGVSSHPRPKKFDSSTGVDRKVGRNDPCPCGSGKKYKKCHGK